MPDIQFFPYCISYETSTLGKAMIQLFGKTLDNKKICVLDPNFEPYFYVIPRRIEYIKQLIDKISIIKLEDRENLLFVADIELSKMKFLDKPIDAIKVTVNHPNAVQEIKKIIREYKEVEDIHEADIPFVKRYFLDKNIVPFVLTNVSGEFLERPELNVDFVFKADNIIQQSQDTFENPKVLAFDIEVYTPEKRYPIEEKDPIIMLGFSCSDGFKKVITWKRFKTDHKYIEFVDSEQDLILKFIETIHKVNPDFLVGYFSDGFDLPYIKTRANKYGIKIKFNNATLKVVKRGNNATAKFKGLPHLDIFKFIRNIMSGSLRLDNYGLGRVSEELLKEKKLDMDTEDICVIWDQATSDLDKFCEYNLNDAELALKLFQKIFPNLEEIVKLVNLTVFDVCRMSYSKLVESYIMKRSKEFNEIYPNKPDQGAIAVRRMHTYQGASVIEPEPGLFENIAVIDFKGFWPSILVAHNISPSTLTDNKEESYVSPDIIDENGETINYYFTYKQDGFIPLIVKDLILRRNRVKEILKNEEESPALKARYYALKTISNATYGYFGFFGARWYCRECSASITAWGREYIKKLIEKAREENFKVIYSDTDSIFLALEKKSKDDVLIFIEKLNRELPSLMELDLENFYPRGIFVMKRIEKEGAKKKYALISEEGNIIVKGFETIRRDWSYIAKEVQKNVIDIILKENSPKKAYDYVTEVINNIKLKNIPKEKMIIQTQLKKKIENYDLVGPHVTVAKKMREQGIYIGPGAIIKYIVTEGKGLIRDKAEIPEEASSYDPDYYINNQILPAVDRIFEALGYDSEGLVTGVSQSKLDKFTKK